MNDKINVTENLRKLSEISDWFEDQEQIDVEEGLLKVKEAAGLIQESKKRLQDIQNEFIEVKRQIEEDNQTPEMEVEIELTPVTVSNEDPSDNNPF